MRRSPDKQVMIAKPSLDDLGDTVTPFGVFINSKDDHGAQLFHRIPLNTIIGLIMSVRAVDFESIYGPYYFPAQETTNSQCGPPIAWRDGFSLGKNGFDCTL